jgi:hypothetical protein
MECVDKLSNPSMLFSYVYNHHITRLFRYWSKKETIIEQLKQTATDINFINGSSIGEVGTIIEFLWKDTLAVKIEVTSVVLKEHFKRVVFYVTCPMHFSLSYTAVFSFYCNSSDDSTFYQHENIFENPDAMKIIDKKHDTEDKLKSCHILENILIQNTDDLYQFESVLIESGINTVWKIVSDWNGWKNVDETIEDVEYKGNKYEIGTKILINDATKKSKYTLQIIHFDKKKNEREIHFVSVDGDSNYPRQILKLYLYSINRKYTFFSFKHEFKEYVKHASISAISSQKKKILYVLKERLEINTYNTNNVQVVLDV